MEHEEIFVLSRRFLLLLRPLTMVAGLEIFVGSAAAYTGPCDLQTCGEAWGVDYATTTNYAGPLFRLALISSPTTTYDVGQTPSRTADTAGALAFCGGAGTMSPHSPPLFGLSVNVSSTCKIDKIYAQIQGHINDLVYREGLPGYCTTGNLQCAATYAIETTSGLPLLWSPQGAIFNSPTYLLAGDRLATGITGGNNSVSIVYVGSPIIQTPPWSGVYCCGVFGLTHQASQPDTTGTDFMFLAGYGWDNAGGVGVNVNCVTSSTYCIGAEEESTNDVGDYAASGGSGIIVPAIHNIMGAAVFNQPTNTVSGYLNGVNLFNHSPPAPQSSTCPNPGPPHPCPLSPGTAVHFGAGGDLSQPDPFVAREMLILNLALTGAQYQALFSNIRARYTSLTFPGPSRR